MTECLTNGKRVGCVECMDECINRMNACINAGWVIGWDGGVGEERDGGRREREHRVKGLQMAPRGT